MAVFFQLRAQYVGNYGGGTISIGPTGSSFNVGAALTAGGGTITATTVDLVDALTKYPPLFQSGSDSVPLRPSATARFRIVSLGSGSASSESALEVQRDNEAYPRLIILADGTITTGDGTINPVNPVGSGVVGNYVSAVPSPSGHYWSLATDNTGALTTTDVGTTAPVGTPFASASDLANLRARNPINVKDSPYNAIGDGVNDDSAEIQAAIDAATAFGGVVELPPGVYKLGTTLALKSNVILRGVGNAILDFRTTTKVGTARRAITAFGTLGASVNLATDAVKGAYTTTLGASATAGDLIQLNRTATYVYPGAAVKRGEIKRVRVGGTAVTFDDAIYDDYPTSDTSVSRVITPVSNVAVEGVNFLGNNTPADLSRAIEFAFVDGFSISGCSFDAVDLYCVSLWGCLRGDVTSNRFRGVFYDGITGSDFYAVALFNDCQWVRVSNNHAEQVRHLYVNSGGLAPVSGLVGAPRHITVTGNVAHNMEADDAGASWAFEHHGIGENVVIANNVMDGCYGGFVTRGPGVSFIGNLIRNWSQYAIQLHTELTDARNIIISDNVIDDQAGPATAPMAIRGDLTAATPIQNVIVSNNTISLTRGDVEGAAISMLGTGTDGHGLLIEGNKIVCTATRVSYVLAVTPDYATMRYNHLVGTDFGIRARGANQKVIGNEVENQAIGAGIGIFTDQANTRLINNYVRNMSTALRLAVGATGSVMLNNIVDGATIPYSVQETAPGKIIDNINIGEATTIASAATVTLPTGNGDFYTISGTANITSVTASHVGRGVTLLFSGTNAGTGLTDGGNLKLASNLVYTPDDTITLRCDGTNWYEVARSVN